MLLFVVLGTYLWLVESEKIRMAATEKRLFPTLALDQLTGVELEYPDRRIVLRKTGDGWRIEAPRSLRADQTAVENLARAIVDLEIKRTLNDPAEPETYGLESPKTVVGIQRIDGATVSRIRVGKNTPVGYSTFLQLEGESTVRLAASSFATGMDKRVQDLRDKQILDIAADKVRRIRVEAGDGESFALVRTADAGWTLERADSRTADGGEVGAFLSSLGSLRAQAFFDDPKDLERFGLENPRRRIALEIEGQSDEAVLLVGGEGGEEKQKNLYLLTSGSETVYGVGTYAWTNLAKTASAFRSKTVLVFDQKTVGSIELTRAEGEAVRIERAPARGTETDAPRGEREAPADRWIVTGADATNEAATRRLVGDLQALRGFEVAEEDPAADRTPFGLVTPELTFSIVGVEQNLLGQILVSRVGDGEEGATYAMAEGGDLVFRIRDYLYSHLDKTREDLVKIEPAPPDEPAAGSDPKSRDAPAP